MRIFSGITLVVLLWAPKIVEACSVCSVGREDENRVAFLITTVFLSLLPLAMIGGTVWWFWRRSRQLAREQVRTESPATLISADLLR